MNKSLIVIGVALTLGACATGPAKVDTVREEELSTDFVAEGIKVTSKGCSILSKVAGKECEIVAIESTSTDASNGGSTWNRKDAMDAACAYALTNVVHWKGERVTSNRTVTRTGNSAEASSSKETQNSNREIGSAENSERANENNIRREVINVIRIQASSNMEGWSRIKQEVVGPQEVSCTVGWSKKNTLLKKTALGL